MRVKLAFALLGPVALAACGGGVEPQAAPDVRGERLDVAERRLDDRNLDFERVGGGALGIVIRSSWQVCEQEPAPGRKATKVRLIVDRHCPPVPPLERVVPDLVGLRVDRAEALLERRDLAYDVESQFPDTPVVSPRWVVCEQEPPAGERASRVALYAASDCDAPPPPPLVPDVIGEDLDDAEALLEERGIGYAVYPADVDPGRRRLWEVCDQDPAPGEEGDFVDLEVARRCSE
jgi:beta-lactam-binding protein with PASTA domain